MSIDYNFVLAVRGTNTKELRKFRKAVTTRGTRLSFNKLVPMPKNIEDSFSYETRQRWQKKHWGTERDAYTRRASFLPEKNMKDVYLWYDTDGDGGVPIPWLKTISPMFPTLSFAITYRELCPDEGKKYWEGHAEITDGRITKKYAKRVVEPVEMGNDFFDDYEDKGFEVWHELIRDRAYFISEDELIPDNCPHSYCDDDAKCIACGKQR